MAQKEKSAPAKKRRGYKNENTKDVSEDGGKGSSTSYQNSPTASETTDSRPIGEIQQTRQFVDRIHRWFRQSSEASKQWREAYIENMKFLSNDQWSDEDKSLLDDEDGGRPYLVINKVLGPVLTISGVQRQSRQEIKLLPFEPDDADSTELMQTLLKFVRDKNKMNREDSRVFVDKIAAGLGFWKVWYDYRRRPQGEIKCTRLNPLNIFWDPNWPECGWDETQYVIDAKWYSLEEAVEEWPDFEEQIRSRFGEWIPATGEVGVGARGEAAGDPQSLRRDFWDAQTQRVRVLEVSYKELIKADVAIFKDGEVISDPDQVERIKSAKDEFEAGGDLDAAGAVTITKRPVQYVRVAHVLDDILLDDDDTPLPFNEFNIVPSLGFYFWKHPFGMVDVMKDPQKEKNKRRMAITEIASRAAHSGFYNKRGAGADREDLERYTAGAGAVIEYESERPQKIDAEEIPQVLVLLENKADAEINQVVNVNQELLGQTTQVTVSGRAIEARQRGGLLTQGIFFDTFAEEMEEVARLLIAMIKDNMTTSEAFRILGSLATREQDNQDAQNPLQGKALSDVERTLSRAFSTEYDVVISVKPEDPTHAFAVWQTFLEFAKQVPVPPDMMVKAATKAGVIDKADGEPLYQALLAQRQPQPGAQPGGAAPPAAAPSASPVMPVAGGPGGGGIPVSLG